MYIFNYYLDLVSEACFAICSQPASLDKDSIVNFSDYFISCNEEIILLRCEKQHTILSELTVLFELLQEFWYKFPTHQHLITRQNEVGWGETKTFKYNEIIWKWRTLDRQEQKIAILFKNRNCLFYAEKISMYAEWLDIFFLKVTWIKKGEHSSI